MDAKDLLRSVPALAHLEDEDCERLTKLARVRKVKLGESIDVQGDPATLFFVIVNGRVAVTLRLDFGVSKKNYMVTTVGPGQMVGWSGMVGNPIYTAGSKALTDATLLEFDVEKLENEFEEDPRLGYVMMKGVAATIASRLRHMQLQLVQQYAVRESAE